MASKLLRPQDVGENIQSFCTLTRDAVSYLAKTRGGAGFDNEIPNLEGVLYNFSAESKYINQWKVEVSAACPRLREVSLFFRFSASNARARERRGCETRETRAVAREEKFFVPLPSRAISHARGHLRVSRFARQTTEKRETARSLSLSKPNWICLPYLLDLTPCMEAKLSVNAVPEKTPRPIRCDVYSRIIRKNSEQLCIAHHADNYGSTSAQTARHWNFT